MATLTLEIIKDYNYVALVLYQNNGESHYCSATILSNNKVLTAAKCVYNSSNITLVLGTRNVAECEYKVNINEKEIFKHPKYNPENSADPYDLAVFQFKKKLKFDAYVNKISMVDNNYTVNSRDEVQMWGYSDNCLQHVNLLIEDREQCQVKYSEENNLNVEERRQFCVNQKEKCEGTAFTGGIKPSPVLLKTAKICIEQIVF